MRRCAAGQDIGSGGKLDYAEDTLVYYLFITPDAWQGVTFMKSNVGGIDKIARIVVGALLILLALTGTIGAWGWIGVVPLATGLFNFCPAYSLFGINTCKLKK